MLKGCISRKLSFTNSELTLSLNFERKSTLACCLLCHILTPKGPRVHLLKIPSK